MRAWLTRRGSVRVEVQAARESSSMRGAAPRVMERSKDREARAVNGEDGRRWEMVTSGGGVRCKWRRTDRIGPRPRMLWE